MGAPYFPQPNLCIVINVVDISQEIYYPIRPGIN